MRWDEQRVGEGQGQALPGYHDPATVRTFDAPEALDVRFYEVRAKSVLNRVPKQSQVPFRWTINPYRGCTHACVYCFARPTHKYLDFDAGRDFEREIVVKVNAPEVARAELTKPRWGREHVAMGTNTDPYQWVEGRYELMPGIWEALRDSGTPGSILSKSPLLLRDKQLMKEAGATANLSIPTLEEKAWRATEPHTPHPRARIEAVAELNRSGVPCGVLIAPLIPGVNDDPRQVEELLELCAEAGATNVGGIALHLRGEVKQLWFQWLEDNRPDLLARYRRLYRKGAYAPKEERQRLAKLTRRRGQRTMPRSEEGTPRPPRPRQGVQASLF